MFMCINLPGRGKAQPAADKGLARSSHPLLRYVTASRHSLLRALVPATCGDKRVALLAAMF